MRGHPGAMADDAAPAPSPSTSSPDLDPAPPLSEEAFNPQPTVYQFFIIWEAEDMQACCVGAESLQGAINPTLVQLLCLECDRVRHATPHLVEVVI